MQPKRDASGAAASPAARPLRPGDSARITRLKADLLRASFTLPADALSSQVGAVRYSGCAGLLPLDSHPGTLTFLTKIVTFHWR